ncbi:hypothetical protein WLF14_01735 [Pseudomonas fluorescens]|uniref:hypothetical protein n=1 Tax=Pseudomonas fluorescens TaxID=294 RepID=UPI00313E3E19
MNAHMQQMSDLIRPHASRFCGMCLVSMDHSPSEQLIGDGWYTTVIVVSPAIEHSALANAVAKRLRPRTPRLMKWCNATRHYKREFGAIFAEEMERNPAYVFAISATKAVIVGNSESFIDQTGLRPLFTWSNAPHGKRTLTFGPFFTENTERFVQISERRALMVLFILNFFIRIFAVTRDAVSPDLQWCVFMDKFAGGEEGSMATLFGCLLDATEAGGYCIRGSFGDSDLVETDLLADNLTGYIDSLTQRGLSPPLSRGEGKLFWERYS